MARVVIATGIAGADGEEQKLSEYLCDCPNCPNYATEVVGFSRELGMALAVCSEHARHLRADENDDRAR